MSGIVAFLKSTWENATPPMRFGGAALLAVVFFGLVFLALFSQPNMQPLFSNLQPEDAGQIIAHLRDNGIAYQIADNGQTIRVPQGELYEARLALAEQGLPGGGIVGFEIFNVTRLGETEADRQLRFLWALQGELTRTIRAMREVEDARVHIVLPQRSLFVQDSRESSASILLQLRPGTTFGPKQVQGVTHLVAMGVEGLAPERVTIVDTSGNVLSGSATDILDGQAIADRFQIERAFERDLQTRLLAMLERVYGYGSVVAQVSVELDFDQLQEFEERFDPVVRDSGVVRSEQRLAETLVGEPVAGSGEPGVASNIPGYMELQSDERTEWERSESIINYEINRLERHLAVTPGGVRRLSVSVLVNGSLTPAQIGSIESSVALAIGFRAERGDQIFVDSMEFETTGFITDFDSLPEPQLDRTTIYLLAVGIGLLLLLLFLATRRKQPVQRAPEQAPAEPAQEEVAAAKEEQLQQQAAEEYEKLKDFVQELAERDPHEFAKVIKTLIAEK